MLSVSLISTTFEPWIH